MKYFFLLIFISFSSVLISQEIICSVNSLGSEPSFERRSWGQSFSTPCSGEVNRILFNSNSSLNENFTFSLYDGEDCESTLLYSQSLNGITGDNIITFQNSITLNQNNTYFFQVVSDNSTLWSIHYSNQNNVSGILRCTSNNGIEDCGRTFPSFDMNFSVELIGTPPISQEVVSSGRVSVTFNQLANGVSISSITDNGLELLNNEATDWFTLNLFNVTTEVNEEITSCCDWNSIELNNNGGDIELIFSNPTNANLPNSLTATVTVVTNNDKSTWDMSVTGLGTNYSLMNVDFPKINIKAEGNDTFLYPLYSGKLVSNPANGIDYYGGGKGVYPRGWSTTMQFMAYYNNNYGIYFGFHDPGASLKQFQARDFNGGVEVSCKNPAPNETVAGNDWQLPGTFEFDLFNGDWYDASLMYKKWTSSSADYWPTYSTARNIRQHTVGDIGLWLTTYVSEAAIQDEEGYIQTAANFYDFPVGIHLYEWNDFGMDHNYPTYFPETEGFDSLVQNIQTNNENHIIMPYINGRMWDVGTGTGNDPDDAALAAYFHNNGEDDAVKYNDVYVHDDSSEGNDFAIMCPTQSGWQNIIRDVSDEITRTDRLGAKAVYLDMVAASPQKRCTDPNHGHPLGGGTIWRDGYKEMLSNIHNTIPEDDFLTVEGGCDYLVDEVDAFMVQGWTTSNQVPAWGAVYTGQVQMFGTKTDGDEYGSQSFYSKLAQGFSFGVQTGRQYIWLSYFNATIPENTMASNYVRNLGRMRYKLRDFMSYGEMKRPIEITGTIPNMSYQVLDWGGAQNVVDVVEPAIQKSVWKSGDSVVIVFVNAEMPNTPNGEGTDINFSFDFVGRDYGLLGDLTIQEITPTNDGDINPIENNFTQNVTLSSLQQVAYIITSTPSECVTTTNVYTFEYDGKTYEVIKDPKTWEDAANCALEREGELVRINDEAEQTAIWNELNNNAEIDLSTTIASNGGGASYVWLGGNDIDTEGVWIWDGVNNGTGDQFWEGGVEGNVVGGLYTNWGNEPDNAQEQDCLGMALTQWPINSGSHGTAGQWNDLKADNLLCFIIEHSTILSVDEFDKTDVVIYPNPVDNMLKISSLNKVKSVTIINSLGQIIKNIKTTNQPEEVQIDFSGINSGVYLVKVNFKNGKTITKKVIK